MTEGMREGRPTNSKLGRRLRRAGLAAGVLLTVLSAGGCHAWSIGTHPEPMGGFEWKAFGGNAHADIEGLATLDSFQGAHEVPNDIVKAGLLWGADKDDWITLDIWPLVGFGAGAAGFRGRIGPAQAGAGFGFSEPTPLRSAADYPSNAK